MSASSNENEWTLLEKFSETYAMPESADHKDPEDFNRLVRSRIPPRGKRFTHDHHDTCAYIARSKNLNVVAYTANFVVPAGTPGKREAGDQRQHHTAPQKSQQSGSRRSSVSSGHKADCVIDSQNPIHAYFVNLEPSYLAERRKKGIVGDCDDLKMLERRFAYGCNFKVVNLDRHIKEQLPSHLKAEGRLSASLAAAGSDAKKTMLANLADWWRPLEPMMGSFVALPVWPAMLVRLKPLSSPSSTDEAEESWCSDADTIPAILAVIDKKLSVLEKVYVKSIERWLRLPTVEYIEVFGVGLEDGKPTYEKQMNNGQYQPPSGISKEAIAEALKI